MFALITIYKQQSKEGDVQYGLYLCLRVPGHQYKAGVLARFQLNAHHQMLDLHTPDPALLYLKNNNKIRKVS